MNKIFKVIWSKARNCYIVVSELAKSHDDGHVRRSRCGCARKAAVLAAFVLTMGVSGAALAADMPQTYTKDNVAYTLSSSSNLTGIYYNNDRTKYVVVKYQNQDYNPNAATVKTGSITFGDNSAQIIAAGVNASANRTDAIALGTEAAANGERSIAIGKGASTKNEDAQKDNIAIGTNAYAGGDSSVVIGNGAKTKDQAQNTIVLGKNANGDGSENIVLGTAAKATNSYSIAIGTGAQANNDGDEGSVAIGHSASTSSRSIAIGAKASVTQDESVAIGHNASVPTQYGVAIGSNAKTSGNTYGTAIGYSAESTNQYATALGANAKANHIYDVALGDSSVANGATEKDNVKYIMINGVKHQFSNAVSQYAVSVGNENLTRQIKRVANGEVSPQSTDAINGSQLYAIAQAITNNTSGGGTTDGVHYYSVNSRNQDENSNYTNHGAIGTDAMAAGVSAKATGVNSMAVGKGAQASANSAVAIGDGAKAVKQDSIALGTNAKAEGQGALVVGNHNSATGQNAVAFGGGYDKDEKGNTASATASLAFGENTVARAEGAVAFGYGTQAGSEQVDNNGKNYGQDAVAFGNGTKALGGRSLAFGERTLAEYTNAVAFGADTQSRSNGATAFGSRTRAMAQYSTSFGNRAVAAGNFATAFGTDTLAGVKTDASGAMWLTSGTKIDSNGNEAYTDANGNTYAVKNFRNVKNGQPFGEIHDYVVVKGTDGNNYIQDYHGDIHAVTLTKQADGTIVATASTDIAKNVTLVTAAPTSTGGYDFVDYDNATAFGESTKAINVNATALGKNSVASGENSLAFGEGSTAAGNNSVAGLGGTASTANSIALGKDTKANNADNAVSVAIGQNAEASGARSLAIGFGVSEKVGTKDDTNLTQTTASGESAVSIGTDTQAAGQHSLAMGSHTSAAKDSSIAIGYDTHAVNDSTVAIGSGTQARGRYSVAMGLSSVAGKETNDVNNPLDGGGSVAIGYAAAAEATRSVAIGTGSTAAEAAFTTALGDSASAKQRGSVAVGAGSVATRAAGNKENGTDYKAAYRLPDLTNATDAEIATWTSTEGAVSVGGTATYKDYDANGKQVTKTKLLTRQITNVAAGSEDTDAVNVAQLKQAGFISYKANGGTAQTVTLKDGLDFTNGTNTTAEVGANGVVKFNVADSTFKDKAREAVIVKQGDNVTVKTDADEENHKTTYTVSAKDTHVTSGTATYADNGTGTITLTNNDNSTVTVSGLKNIYTTGVTADAANHKATFNRNDGSSYELKLSDLGGSSTDYQLVGSDGNVGNGEANKYSVANNKVSLNVKDTMSGTTKTVVIDNIASKTDLDNQTISYTANSAAPKKSVKLSEGLNFTDGTNTTAEVGVNGVVKFNVADSTFKDKAREAVVVNAGDNVTVTPAEDETNHKTTYTVSADNMRVKSGTATYNTDGTGTIILTNNDGTTATVSGLKDTYTKSAAYDAANKKATFTRNDNSTYDLDLSAIASEAGNVKLNFQGENTDTTISRGNSDTLSIVGDGTNISTNGDATKSQIKVALNDNLVLGKDGTNGKDGSIGIAGKDGADGYTTTIIKTEKGQPGKDGKNGQPGVNGTDITRIVYGQGQDGKDGKQVVATLDDGQKYAGDNYVAATDQAAEQNVIAKKLNERLDIKGGANKDNLTDKNIGVNAVGGALKVQLAKNIDLTDGGSVTTGNTVINNMGLTVGGKTYVSSTGLNANSQVIANVANGSNDNDAVNVSQLKDSRTTVTSSNQSIKVQDTTNGNPNHAYDIMVDYGTVAKNTSISYKANGGTAQTVTLKEGLDFTNGTNTTAEVGANGVVKFNVADSTFKDKARQAVAVEAGDNVTVTPTKDDANHKTTYTVSAADMRVNSGTATYNTDGTGTIILTNNDGTTATVSGLKDTYTKSAAYDAASKKATFTRNDNTTYDLDLSDIANEAGRVKLNFKGDNADTTISRGNSDTLSIVGDGTNISTTGDATKNEIKVALNDNLVLGKDGKDGKDGVDGTIGVNGKDGSAVVINGKDGSIGLNGKDGANGLTIKGDKGAVGVDGTDGKNGKDGMTRIVYQDGKDTDHTVATLDDGMKYAGNFGQGAAVKLNKTVTIKGNLAANAKEDDFVDGNIAVTANKSDDNGELLIKLNKNLTGLNSSTYTSNMTSGGTSTTVVDGSGLKITNGPSITYTGIDAGSHVISHVADGKAPTDAVNVSQLTKVEQEATAHSSVEAGPSGNVTVTPGTNKNGGTKYTVDLADNVNFGKGDKKISINGDNGTVTIGQGDKQIKLDSKDGSISAGGVTINKDGKGTVNGLTNTTWDGEHITSGQAATEDQLQKVEQNVNTKIDNVNNKVDKVAKQHTTVSVNGGNAQGNLVMEKTNATDEKGANYDISLSNDVTIGTQGENGKDGKLTVTSKDGTKAITADGQNGTLTFKDGNNETSIKAAEASKGVDGKTDIKRVAIDGHTVATTDDGMKFAGDSGDVIQQKLNSTTNIKGGATGALTDGNIGVVSDGNNTLTVKLAKDIKGLDSVTATTVNATTVNSSSFNIAGDDSHDAITIKQGDVNMGGNTISGVAPGKVSQDSTDAINGSQLWQRDQAINSIGGAVNKLGSRVNRVGAGAAALAALHPLDFDPDDKWDFAAGYGNYRGANAAAVGAYYRPNEDTMFSVGGSFGGGENMVNAGVSFKLGQGNHVSTSRVAMAKEIKDLRQNVANLNAIVNRQSALIDKLTGTNAGMIKDKGNDLFPDVPANHWAYEYVTKLKHAGILTGYPDGNFDGDRMMTRYEFAAIVYRAIMAGAASNPALNQDGTLDKLANEFSSEMKYIRIDTIAKDKNGKPTIERVRVISDAK